LIEMGPQATERFESVDTEPVVSVVIPSYNRKKSMLELLADVYAQQGVRFEVLVVDDCSTDESPAAIRSAFPQTRLFVNEQNGGPAVSRNKGIQEAKGRYIVGFDSDVTVPDRLCLEKVVRAFDSKPDIHGIAFRLLQPDGQSEDYARWWHPVPIADWAERAFLTSYFSGTGYAFRRDAVLKAGMYPEILYMHYEEEELAYRFLDEGYQLAYLPEVTVIHHEGQVSRRSEIKMFYKNRNQILVAIACMPIPRAVCYIFPRLAFAFLRSIAGRYFGTFLRMLRSARELSVKRWKTERKPLHAQTWKRIRSFKLGIQV